MQVFIPVSHCKDTHNFDKANNFIKKLKKRRPGVWSPLSETYRITLLVVKVLNDLPKFSMNQL